MKILHILIVKDEPWVAMDLEMIIHQDRDGYRRD
jgi:hypothetical protein